MTMLDPLTTGYIASALVGGRYDTLSSVNLDVPASDSLEKQRLLEEVMSLVHTRRDELHRYAASHPGPHASQREIKGVLSHLEQHAKALDPKLVAAVQAVLPDLTAEREAILARLPFKPFGPEEAHVLALARWFKGSFMTWVDPIACTSCGGKTVSVGDADPTSQERLDGGGRVEIHRCEVCGTDVRFIRYGEPMTLLRERRGRCGEWAHLFYVMLLVSGLNARYIWNSEDHVWNEYWSPAARHWVHVDSCEATIAKPLLYARGWGKKQAVCLAVGKEGAEDVTRAYVDDWTECLRRRKRKGWSEGVLRQSLMEMTVRLRLRMSRQDLLSCEERDAQHTMWLGDEERRWKEAEAQNLGGRTSGPEDWRAARDELGEADKVVEPTYTVLRSLGSTKDRDVQLLGNATKSDGIITLTTKPDQVSAVFLPTTIDPSSSFRARLPFRMTAPPGGQGADGMALVFASEISVGGGGFGLGYDGLGQKGDVAIEIDTFCSYDHAEDPAVPHISLHLPPRAHHKHSIVCTRPGAVPLVNDGRTYTLEVVYDGSTRSVWAFLGVPGEEDRLGLWKATLPVPTTTQETVARGWYIGVSGATGGLWQKQEVIALEVDAVALVGDGAVKDDS